METALQDYLNGLCCSAPPNTSYNFDVESSNWSSLGVTDQASFNFALNVTTNNFKITGNKIEANIISDLGTLNIIGASITKVNYLSYNSSLGNIQLSIASNQIFNFSPSTLGNFSSLILDNNQITTINFPLGWQPSNWIGLRFNQLTNDSYSNMETWANSLGFSTGKDIFFNGNIDPISGTNLKTILESKGWTVFG